MLSLHDREQSRHDAHEFTDNKGRLDIPSTRPLLGKNLLIEPLNCFAPQATGLHRFYDIFIRTETLNNASTWSPRDRQSA